MGTQSTTPMYIIEAEEAWVPSLPHQCISLKHTITSIILNTQKFRQYQVQNELHYIHQLDINSTKSFKNSEKSTGERFSAW